METGTILLMDVDGEKIRPAVAVQNLQGSTVLVCAFTMAGPQMVTATRGTVHTLMVFVPDA